MKHKMLLSKEPFEAFRRGEKKIEVRCRDEKRKRVNIGDEIEFHMINNEDEVLIVKVKDLYSCKSFYELYSMFSSEEFGHKGESVEHLVEGIRDTYSEEREMKEGVLGIRVEVLE